MASSEADNYARVIGTLFYPLLVFQTARHWYAGTYFPLIAADSFYTARTGHRLDRRPQRIFYLTWWIMVYLAMGTMGVTAIYYLDLNCAYHVYGMDKTSV